MRTKLVRLARRLGTKPVRLARRLPRLVDLWREARTVAAAQGLSAWRLLYEQRRLYLFYDITPDAYYLYRLFDPALPWVEKTRYLPSDSRAMNRLWATLTPRQYYYLYHNKLIFHRFFSALGLPLAKLYGIYDPAFGHTADGRPLRDAADLRAWLCTAEVEEFVFKPMEGMVGRQVLVFASRAADDPGVRLTLAGDKYDADRLVAFAGNGAFLIEERFRPHPDLAALIGPTLCCIRVQTIISRAGEPQILAAVFKIQPKPIGVDHLVYGAVGAWVDLESGVLGRGRTRFDLAYTSVIPGTEIRFEGFQLPDWAEAKALALRAAAAFPWAGSIGWDIALSDRGPVLIEGNERWLTTLIQIPAPHGLMTGELKALCQARRR